MATSVMVNESTLQMLRELKARFHAKSYDETLMKLVMETTNVPDSKFGTHPKLRPFTKEDRSVFHEL
ncbi:MAG: hypothetical protein V1744_01120 [Candidatus Altiarchaeota archaeon]